MSRWRRQKPEQVRSGVPVYVKKSRPEPLPAGPIPPPFDACRWLSGDESPFGIEVLDCRPAIQGFISLVGDGNVAMRYGRLRGADGSELVGVAAEDPLEVTVR